MSKASFFSRFLRRLALLLGLTLFLAGCDAFAASDLQPISIRSTPDDTSERFATYSNRSLRVAIEVDRDGARVLAFTARNVPLVQSLKRELEEGRGSARGLTLEIVLTAADGRRHVRRVDAGPLCLLHGPTAEPHVNGDTIKLHRDSMIVELPDVAGFDRIEVGHYPGGREKKGRVLLGTDRLDATRFTPAGTSLAYASLAIARRQPAEAKTRREIDGAPIWPEQFGDTDLYRVHGDPAEGSRRVNITIVPDGYTIAEKTLIETHAAELVAAFRARTPYKEHDPFINYTLVYVYSAESGTDQCDCGTIVDTAMGTGFPAAGGPCGSAVNRCLYYGASCDSASSTNIALAELRAPFHDATIVMVNTSRYGGCGGTRAVYSAGNPAATEIAIHELGHSLAGLSDEYGGSASCGGAAGEINTSVDGVDGAWPEWLEDLGPPVEGAQYYDNCLFRPVGACQMRSLSMEFCPVCRQQWARVFLGHPRVRPSAPIASLSPGTDVDAWVGHPVELQVHTRLPDSGTVNHIDWYLTPPEAEPVWVAGGSPTLVRTFETAGTHRVTVQVVADAEVIKPVRWGDNVDVASFDVVVQEAVPPPEISPAGSHAPLLFEDATHLIFSAVSPGTGYNVYRGDVGPDGSGTYGSCLAAGLAEPALETVETPPAGDTWSFLATASNPIGEGSLGTSSTGVPRTPVMACD